MPVLFTNENPGTATWSDSARSGNAATGNSTAFGTGSGSSTLGNSGAVTVSSGAALLASGDVNIASGNASTGASGNVILGTGTVVTGQTRGTVQLDPTARPEGWNGLSPRFELKWVAGQRGVPGINGDIVNAAEGTRMAVDPWFEVVGTNAATAGSTAYAEGGITIATAGAQNDQQIIAPHLTAGGIAAGSLSPWSGVTWGTDKETEWECEVMTTADIVGVIIWAGLKLTNTPTTATDANQAFFRYQSTVAGGSWQAIDSIGGVDVETDTGIDVAINTKYHLKIVITSARLARFYINGVLVSTSAALTDATDFIPYIGVAEGNVGANAESVRVMGQSISRVIG